MVDAPVENIIMYIPVADATYAGTPILNNNGLKTLPPPIPSAPDIQPPMKLNSKSLNSLTPFIGFSLFPKPAPYLILRFYSFWS